MVFIYVIKCEQNKWYIGKTENSKFRIDTHFDNNGSSFTKTFPPVEIYQIIPECDKFDEDKYVKKYMDKYGIDNVRGGTYSTLELTQQEKTFIQKELWGANDLCFECGGEHFIKDCPNNKDPVILQSTITENNDNKKNKFLTNLKNELFELTEGCWIQFPYCNLGYGPYTNPDIGWTPTPAIGSNTININYPNKIYKKYNQLPLSELLFNDINKSDAFILQKEKTEINQKKLLGHGIPEYENKIYITFLNNKNDNSSVSYYYKFSRKFYENYMHRYERASTGRTSELRWILDSKNNYDKQVNDLKLKIFMLENMNLSENEDNNMMLVD